MHIFFHPEVLLKLSNVMTVLYCMIYFRHCLWHDRSGSEAGQDNLRRKVDQVGICESRVYIFS
jgi:hypothetical protein